MKLFLTGHTGFKGAWAISLFERLGAATTGYALAPDTQPSLFDEAGLERRVRHVVADIRDAKRLRDEMQAAQPDAVLHMAAQSLVLRGLSDPAATFDVNVMGTANVLEAIAATPSVRVAVIVTSDKCYEPSARALHEGDPLGGHDPYSASKACAEIVVEGYRRLLEGRIVATARAGNVVGGGDWADRRIVADLARAAASGGELVLRHPQAVRPWQHVLDALSGYATLLRRGLSGDASVAGAWNFGPDPDRPIAVSEVVNIFSTTYGRRVRVRVDAAALPENPMLVLDSSRARSHLGWRPAFDASEALHDAAEFYRRRDAGESVGELLEQRVARFCERTAPGERVLER